MWKKFLKCIGAIPKKETEMLYPHEIMEDEENEFNKNCNKIIKELKCNLTAEEIYARLEDKEVIIEIHSGIPNVIKKSQGIKLTIKDFDIDGLGLSEEGLNGKEYILSEWCADSKV